METLRLATFHEGPLVGRTMELNGLIDTYKAVQRGQSRIVILKGDLGIGKTRLAGEFLRRMEAQGAQVLRGHAFSMRTNPPYQPIIEALGEHYPAIASDPAKPLSTSTELYEAVAHTLLQLSTRQPVVLFIDNVQFADTATLDMLLGLSQRLTDAAAPILCLLVLCQETLLITPELMTWFTRMEQECRAASVTLSELALEHVLQFIGALGGPLPNPQLEALGCWLHAETQGLPLHMVEALDTLLDHNMLTISPQTNGKWTISPTAALNASKLQNILPPALRSIIRARLALLSHDALTLLGAAAVLARPFSFERVCQVADLEERESYPARDEVLTHHFLTEVGNGLFFTHDIIREIVYTALTAAQQRELHHRAFDVLQEEWTDAPQHAAEMAFHAHAAGLHEQAIRLYTIAGDHDVQVFALHNAIDHYEQARQQLVLMQREQTGLGTLPADALQHLHLQLGHAYELIGDREHAHAIYSVILMQARKYGLIESERVALNHLARLIMDARVNFAEAQILRRQMLQIVGNVEPSDDSMIQAETEMHVAQLSFYRFDTATAITHGEHALELAREHDLQEIAARSLYVLAFAHTFQGNWGTVIRYAEEGRRLYVALHQPLLESRCLTQLAKAYISTGQLQKGLSCAREAYEINLTDGVPASRVYSAYQLITALLENASYMEALSLAQQTLTVARAQSLPVMLALGLTALGRVHRALMDPAAAYRLHIEAQLHYQTVPQEEVLEMSEGELCVDCIQSDNWTEAHTYAVRALNRNIQSIFTYQAFTRWYEIAALVHAGESTRATQEVQQFEKQVRNNPRYRISYLRAQAILAHHYGQTAQALEHLREAITLAQQIGLPGELWPLEAERAKLFTLLGDHSHATQALAHAAEILSTIVKTLDDERIRTRFLSSKPVREVLSYTS